MQLSQDTWHYRNFRAWQDKSLSRRHVRLRYNEVQPNLCVYTRIALFYGSWYRFAKWLKEDTRRETAAVFSAFYVVLLALISFVIALSPEQGWEHWMWLVPIGIMAGVAAVIALCLGVFAGIDWVLETIKNRTVTGNEPNIVMEYVKAKKSKICPLIEFADESDETC